MTIWSWRACFRPRAAAIDNQVFEAHAGQLGGQRRQGVIAVGLGHQGQPHFLGQGPEGIGVLRRGAAQQRLPLLDGLGPSL